MSKLVDESPKDRFERWEKHFAAVVQGYERLDVPLAQRVLADTVGLWQTKVNCEQAIVEARRQAVRECVAIAEGWEQVQSLPNGDKEVMDCGDLPERLFALIGEGDYADRKLGFPTIGNQLRTVPPVVKQPLVDESEVRTATLRPGSWSGK